MSYQKKAEQGMDLLKESVLEVIKQRKEAGYMDIARDIPVLSFDKDRDTHKGWFVSNIVTLLKTEGKVKKSGRKWRLNE